MRKLKNKLIVSDFDGTLLTKDQQIPETVKIAINEYVENGGVFAVCTGRMPTAILPQVRALGLKGLLVAYQGAMILEIESGKILKNGYLKNSDLLGICEFAEELRKEIDVGLNVYSDDIYYTDLPEKNDGLKTYEKIIGVEAIKTNCPMYEYVKNHSLHSQRVTFMVKPEDKIKVYNKLCEKFGKDFDVTYSASVLVEIGTLGNDKGSALEFLSEYYNIPANSTVAVGDNLNDLPMIKKAGVGVAVGNAVDALKNEADFIAVTNNEGALRQVIEIFGLE